MLNLIVPVLFALAQAPAPTLAEAPPKPAWSGPAVVIETSAGRIKVGLDKEKAPLSADNFLKYVRSGHYDGTIFHRVIPNFMIQGGGFEEDMTQRPTRPPVKNESKNGRRNLRGTLAMARTNDPHSATAQFFINLKDNAFLDFGVARDGWGYAVFGEVLEGMEVVDKIAGVPTATKGSFQNVPQVPVVIKRVRESK